MRKKSSGIGEYAALGGLSKVSRNKNINNMGDTFFLISIILLIGEIIKLPFKIMWKVMILTYKFMYYLFKYFIKFSIAILKITYKFSIRTVMFAKTKYKGMKTAN